MQLFHKLVHKVTIISILPVCAQVTNLIFGKKSTVILYLLEDTSVGNALIRFYARFDDMSAAYWAFSLISKKDIISGNAILDAFADNSRHSQFINLLNHLMQFCTNVQGVGKLKEVHEYSVKAGLLHDEEEHMLGNVLLDAFAKFGNVVYAHKTFQALSKRKTLVTYNSMFSITLIAEVIMMLRSCSVRCHLLISPLGEFVGRIYAESYCPIEAMGVFHEILSRISFLFVRK